MARPMTACPITRGSLTAFLRNRFYIGEVRYKGEVFPGEQPAILDRALFEAVQTRLDRQRTNHAKARQKSQSLLTGRIFDARGNRMTPSYAIKNGVRYRYYIVRKRLAGTPHTKEETESPDSLNDKELISSHIVRVDVKQDHFPIQLAQSNLTETNLVIPWAKTAAKRPREIILPASISPRNDHRPIRAETRASLVTAIAKGRHWLDELIGGRITSVEEIAATESCTIRQVNMTISLAFLAPSLVQAAVDGRLPRGIGIANLRDAPAEWSLQHARLGLAP